MQLQQHLLFLNGNKLLHKLSNTTITACPRNYSQKNAEFTPDTNYPSQPYLGMNQGPAGSHSGKARTAGVITKPTEHSLATPK